MNKGNLPGPGAMFLDHTGHFIQNADAASVSLSALGFTVTPYSAQVQPDQKTGKPQLTGTGNICVMLQEGYLEFLVYTADTPIGREFKDALDRRAGLHLSAFTVADAAAHHALLQAAGHPMRPLVHFSREVETETGSETARFSVARLKAGTMPEGRVQVLTHFDEAVMWQPRWTSHVNGAQSLRGIVVSAPKVEETAARFEQFLGVESIPAQSGVSLPLERGSIDVLPEPDAEALIGEAIEPGRSVFVALRVGVTDISAMQERVGQSGGIQRGRLVVPFDPALGRGAWIFEQV